MGLLVLWSLLLYSLHLLSVHSILSGGSNGVEPVELDTTVDNEQQQQQQQQVPSTTTIVDSSWPTLHDFDSDIFQQVAPLDNKIRYQEYIKGCIQDSGDDGSSCWASERSRLTRNRYQPPVMSNLTKLGYHTVSIPTSVYSLLQEFWKKNRQFAWTEYWQTGSTIRNHWQQPNCSELDIGRKDFPSSLTMSQLQHIVSSVQQVLEDWTSHPLVLSASVGIRAYLEGTIIAPHVDRMPLVITAVLHIAQHNIDNDNDPNNHNDQGWPLQLVVQDEISGRPILKNITAVPGEMIFYEGTSIIHGRPYPLPKGPLELTQSDDPTYMAVLYLHFEPIGYSVQQVLGQQQQQQQQSTQEHLDGEVASWFLYNEMPTTTEALDKASKSAFEYALAVQQQKLQSTPQQDHEDPATMSKSSSSSSSSRLSQDMVPPYVWKAYHDMYRQRFVFQHEEKIFPKPIKVVFGQISAHQAAALGDLTALKSLASSDRNVLFKADRNGWRPLHEAARSGYADVLEYLLEEGAQVNARTNHGEGGTALYWAEKDPNKNAKAIAVLKKYGGVNISPGYVDEDK
jgi:hypothetical protein